MGPARQRRDRNPGLLDSKFALLGVIKQDIRKGVPSVTNFSFLIFLHRGWANESLCCTIETTVSYSSFLNLS